MSQVLYAWYMPHEFDCRVGSLYDIVSPHCSSEGEAREWLKTGEYAGQELMLELFTTEDVKYDYKRRMYVRRNVSN